jgi:hypothetical protein
MKRSPQHFGNERLSVSLADLAGRAQNDDLTLADLMSRLEGRVYTLLLVLLSLPFCQPLSLPGLSTPFGVVIALLGMRFALRQKPWLPRRLLITRIPSRFLPAVMRGGARLLGWLERFLHPRGTILFDYRITQIVAGVIICVCGLLLLLPLPIPFSNLMPALTVVLLASSFSERDAGVFFAGGVMFLATLGFFALIFFGGVGVVEWLGLRLGGAVEPD